MWLVVSAAREHGSEPVTKEGEGRGGGEKEGGGGEKLGEGPRGRERSKEDGSRRGVWERARGLVL